MTLKGADEERQRELARREQERPRCIPRFPRHPAVEHEEPSTGVYGAWCGKPLWGYLAVHDLVEASAIGREWSETCDCYGTMDYGQVFDPHPRALHRQPHPIKLCRDCVKIATETLWAGVEGGVQDLVHCTYRDGDGVYCARPQTDESLCREHLVARSDFCCEWARADALGHPKVFGAGCDACVAKSQQGATEDGKT